MAKCCAIVAFKHTNSELSWYVHKVSRGWEGEWSSFTFIEASEHNWARRACKICTMKENIPTKAILYDYIVDYVMYITKKSDPILFQLRCLIIKSEKTLVWCHLTHSPLMIVHLQNMSTSKYWSQQRNQLPLCFHWPLGNCWSNEFLNHHLDKTSIMSISNAASYTLKLLVYVCTITIAMYPAKLLEWYNLVCQCISCWTV